MMQFIIKDYYHNFGPGGWGSLGCTFLHRIVRLDNGAEVSLMEHTSGTGTTVNVAHEHHSVYLYCGRTKEAARIARDMVLLLQSAHGSSSGIESESVVALYYEELHPDRERIFLGVFSSMGKAEEAMRSHMKREQARLPHANISEWCYRFHETVIDEGGEV